MATGMRRERAAGILVVVLTALAGGCLAQAATPVTAEAPAAPAPPPAAEPPLVPLACGAAAWRSTALAQRPSANEDYKPEQADWWRTTVVAAAWPALLGLGCAVGLLFLFIIWRCMHCCCGPRKGQPFRRITARWLSCLKVMAALLVAGLAAGCALGMARMDAELVDAGLQTLDSVQVFLSGLIGTAESAVASADAVSVVLGEVQGVLEVEVNATGIAASLQCLAPWLDSLPDPVPLRDDVAAARASVDSVIAPGLADLSTQLGELAARMAPAPAPGAYTAAVQAMVDSRPLLLDAPGGLIPQAQAFVAAAAALGAAENPEQLLPARDALAALLASPQPLAAKLAALPGLRAALGTLQAAATTDPYVPDAAAALAGIRGAALGVQALSSTLRALHSAYTAASPCMLDLLARVDHINRSVLALPEGLRGDVELLREAKAGGWAAFGDLMSGPKSLADLADFLDEALPLGTVDSALQQLQLAVSLRQGIQSLGLPAAIAALAAAEGDLGGSQEQLESALNGANAYLASYYPAGGSPPGTWSALVAGVQAAGSAVDAAVGSIPPLASLGVQAGMLQGVLPALHTTLLDQQAAVGGMQSQLATVPDIQPYLAGLDGLAPTFAALPQPPSQLATQAQAALDDLLRTVQQVLTGARGSILEEASKVRGSVWKAQEQTVGRLQHYREQYTPQARSFDTIRLAVLYGIFSLACLFALLLLLSQLFNYPLGIKLMTVLTLLLMAIFFAGVVVLTAALKVGNDGCVNLEAQIVSRLPDAISNSAEKMVVEYYLYVGSGSGSGSGSGLDAVLLAAFGFDVAGLLQRINGTRQELLQETAERFSLQPLLAAPVEAVVELSYAMEDSIAQLLAAASREAVLPVYTAVKAFLCCRSLDLLGHQWLALLLAGSFGVVLCGLAFSAIASLDTLGRVEGCCACHKRRHFVDEAPFAVSAGASKAAPGSPRPRRGSKQQGEAQISLATDATAGSPRSPLGGLISTWHAKQAAAAAALRPSGGSLREQFSAASPAGGSSSSSPSGELSLGGSLSSPCRAGSPEVAASRAELLGSRGGGGGQGSRGASPSQSPHASGASTSRAAEAAALAEALAPVAAGTPSGSSSPASSSPRAGKLQIK